MRRGVLLLAAFVPGCVLVYERARGPDRLDDDAVASIVPGTSRAAVLERIGPPDAIVRPGAADAASDPAIELFRGRGRAVEGRCVYAYGTEQASKVGGAVLLAAASSRKLTRRRLWILVDDAAGLVEDRVLREE